MNKTRKLIMKTAKNISAKRVVAEFIQTTQIIKLRNVLKLNKTFLQSGQEKYSIIILLNI
jgi:hypothetical protein